MMLEGELEIFRDGYIQERLFVPSRVVRGIGIQVGDKL